MINNSKSFFFRLCRKFLDRRCRSFVLRRIKTCRFVAAVTTTRAGDANASDSFVCEARFKQTLAGRRRRAVAAAHSPQRTATARLGTFSTWPAGGHLNQTRNTPNEAKAAFICASSTFGRRAHKIGRRAICADRQF